MEYEHGTEADRQKGLGPREQEARQAPVVNWRRRGQPVGGCQPRGYWGGPGRQATELEQGWTGGYTSEGWPLPTAGVRCRLLDAYERADHEAKRKYLEPAERLWKFETAWLRVRERIRARNTKPEPYPKGSEWVPCLEEAPGDYPPA